MPLILGKEVNDLHLYIVLNKGNNLIESTLYEYHLLKVSRVLQYRTVDPETSSSEKGNMLSLTVCAM